MAQASVGLELILLFPQSLNIGVTGMSHHAWLQLSSQGMMQSTLLIAHRAPQGSLSRCLCSEQGDTEEMPDRAA